MSSNDTLNALQQEILTEFSTTLATRYSTLSAAVLFLFDHILTFPLEVQHIWHGKMNLMKILFILNRYFGLIFIYGQVLIYFVKPATNTGCSAFNYLIEIANLFVDFATLGIFTFRTFAIYDKSRIVFFLLAVPALVGFSSAIWLAVGQTASALPPQLQVGPWTCNFNSSPSIYIAVLINLVLEPIFDALVVTLTVYRTGRLALQSRQAKLKGSLSIILLRDGLLYYSAIFIPQFVLVALNALVLETNNNNLFDASNAISYVNASIQIVMVNRLVLSLSHAANEREDSEFRSRTGLEPPTFAAGPVLGNIGGPFRTFSDDFDNEILEDDERVDMENVRSTAEPSSTNVADHPSGGNFEIEEINA